MLRRAHWDDQSESWVLERLAEQQPDEDAAAAAAGVSGRSSDSDHGPPPGAGRPWGRRPVAWPGAKRPVSAMARAALARGDMNPRFRWEEGFRGCAYMCSCAGQAAAVLAPRLSPLPIHCHT